MANPEGNNSLAVRGGKSNASIPTIVNDLRVNRAAVGPVQPVSQIESAACTAYRNKRHFNLDRYLHEQLAKAAKPAPRFRPWAMRLNDSIERWMDRCDRGRIEIWFGNVGGMFLSGEAIYFICQVVNAWILGRFNIGAN